MGLAAVASFANCFQFMNFSSVEDLSKEVLDVSDDAVAWLYSTSLLTVKL